MKVVAIIQARLGSTRLPGKVLAEVGGRPLLARQIERLRRARTLDELVVATTTKTDDDAIKQLAHALGVGCFRGPADDVLHRFALAARDAAADVVVRVTADCPLIDPTIIDQAVRAICEQPAACDYASNVLERTYPRGLDVEAMWSDALLRMDRLARSPSAREHVTTFARFERPDLFLLRSIRDWEDNSDLRWTVDTAEDLEYIRRLWTLFDLTKISYRELIARIRAVPGLARFDKPTLVMA
jgi:spore coat polysaccharide biosynthesis protein SpsF